MVSIIGRLVWSGSWRVRPWILERKNGTTVDLYPLIDDCFKKIQGKPSSQKMDAHSYTFKVDDNSEDMLEYESDGLVVLKLRKGFGLTNIRSFMSRSLTWLSGRNVVVTIRNDGFSIEADKLEAVQGIKLIPRSENSGRIPKGKEHTLCKVGTKECCIFAIGTSSGMVCEKFSYIGQDMLDKLRKRELRATRVGSCYLAGKERDRTPKDPTTESMNIYSQKGARVLFNRPNSGYMSDSEHAKRHLVVGKIYTVEKTDVHDSYTLVYLIELPNVAFNSVHFEDVKLEKVKETAK